MLTFWQTLLITCFILVSEVVDSKMFINNNFNRYNSSPLRFGQSAIRSNNNQSVDSSNSGAEFRLKTIAANDFHGHLGPMAQLKTVVDKFKANNPSGDVVMTGDDWVGAYEEKNIAIVRMMNLLGLTAATLGNHNFDNKGSKGVSKMLDYATYKTLALNLKPKEGVAPAAYALQDDIDAGRLASSMVVEKNGRKIGYIGLVPSDLFSRLSSQTKADSQDIRVLDILSTKKALQNEVNKLESQGVNIIKLLSHMGIDADKAIARHVSGIDEIFSAHSHDTLDGLVPGKNLFKSPRGEWVVITQAGKNGHNYAELDVVYDAQGRIIKAKNEIKSLENVPKSLSMTLMEKIMLGAPKQIGTIAHEVKSKPETVLEESPISSFLSDAYLKYSEADIVFNNMGGVRASLPAGPVTDKAIIDLMPFFNDIHVYKLSEKDIIDVLNSAVQATNKFHRTGALQVSGLRYVIGKDDKVKDVFVVKNDGTRVALNAQNPSNDKFFKVAYNTYVAGNSEGLESLNAPDKLIKKCDLNETQMFIEYIKSFNGKPIDIKEDGRIRRE